MKNLRFLLLLFAAVTLLSWAGVAGYLHYSGSPSADRTLKEPVLSVVTSFYPMYIAAENLLDGVDGISLTNLSEPQTGCLHDYTLTPEDMKLLSHADAFVINGGGIESFVSDVAGAYPSLAIIDSSEEIAEHHKEEGSHDTADAHDHEDHDHEGHDHGEENAHYWMSIPLYREQIVAISRGLVSLVQNHTALTPEEQAAAAEQILANTNTYTMALDQLIDEQEALSEKLLGKKVILFHEAYEYVVEDYAMTEAFLLDLDEEREVSAGEVAQVVSAIRDNDVTLILAEETYGREMAELVQGETGVSVRYLDTIVRGENTDGPDAYLTRMQKNIDLLREESK